MSDKVNTGTRAFIAAKYLPLLGEFRAPSDEVRFYLQGIYIEPREAGGVYLCATDGHRLVIVHDENGEADGPMLVNPDKLIIAQSKRAEIADFDGKVCDLMDDQEHFLLRAPAPAMEASFPDWRSLIPIEEIVCEPGAIDPALMVAISKAPFGDGPRNATIYTRQDRPCVVRFPSLPEIFVLVMPMNYPAMRSSPDWVRKPRKGTPPQQSGFDLVGAVVDPPSADSEPEIEQPADTEVAARKKARRGRPPGKKNRAA